MSASRSQLVSGIVDAARELIAAGRVEAADRLLALIGSATGGVENSEDAPKQGRTAKQIRDSERMRQKRLSERQSRDSRQESPATVAHVAEKVASDVAPLARVSESQKPLLSGVVSAESESSERVLRIARARDRRATVASDSRQESPATVASDVATATRLPERAPWRRVWDVWVKVAHGGIPSGDPAAHRRQCETILRMAEARSPTDPYGHVERVTRAHLDARRARGAGVGTLHWLASDYASISDAAGGSSERAQPPIVLEWRELERQHAAATAADNSREVARLEVLLEDVGRRLAAGGT